MHRVATPLARGERIVVPGEKACDAGQPVAAATDARLRLALLTKKRSDLPGQIERQLAGTHAGKLNGANGRVLQTVGLG
jgi:hypothetical protein